MPSLFKTLLIILSIIIFSIKSFSQQSIVKGSVGQLSKINQDTITIIGVGDMMLGTQYPDKSYLSPDDGESLLSPVYSILRDADVTFGNLEGGFLNAKGTPKKCKDSTVCYAFRMPEHYVKHFTAAGFDALSIANNHVGDFGEAGRKRTAQILDSVKINYTGQITCPFDTFTVNGTKFGFCSFSPNNNTLQITDSIGAAALVKKLDNWCDIVIVSFHGGAEGASRRNVPKKHEMFYGEDRGDVHMFAHCVIDAGADVVFGHGPHVTRAVEIYKNRFIAYSLGNFCTYGMFNLKGISGVAPLIKVYTTKKGEFLFAKIISTKQIGKGGTVLDPENKAYNEVMTLTKQDFPNNNIKWGADGVITK
ncbi:MAG: CapA family protein [Bacteroidota bacterium]